MFTTAELNELNAIHLMAVQMAHAITEEGSATTPLIETAVLGKMNDVLEDYLDYIIAAMNPV